MLNSAALRLTVLVIFAIFGIAVMNHEPAAASNATGRACSVSAAPMAPITAPVAPIAQPIEPVVAPPTKRIPVPPAHKGKTLMLEVTGYTSTKGQTDKDPCIIKHRINICQLWRQGHNICASNVFPEGTRVSIDGLEGVYTVMDTMPRDQTRDVDVYFGKDRENDPKGPLWRKARAVGRHDRKVTVVSTP